MPVRIYAHLSWITFARAPLITERVAEFLCRFLLEEATRHGARAIEIGVVRDHVHMLIELPAAFDVPRMVQGLKGASARLANRDGYAGHTPIKWASGYDLRSVGLKQLRNVAEYVRGQEGRHGKPRPLGRV
jgi:REP element-mobilizing transposase RayT